VRGLGHSFTAEDYFALLGRHNLSDSSEQNWQKREITEIIIHDDYLKGHRKADADIALFEMDSPVTYNNYIRPICLPSENSKIDENISGFVTGYGKSEKPDTHEVVPRHYEAFTINTIDCATDGPGYYEIVSKRTFCAKGNGSTSCTGINYSFSFKQLLINENLYP
jgi:hypothetical protein